MQAQPVRTYVHACVHVPESERCGWADLRAAVRRKLQQPGGLSPGALVIDYQASLHECPEFELVDSVEGAVSWNDRQAFFIYRRLA